MQLDAASRGPQVVVPPSDNELPEQGSIPRLRYDFADECVRLWHVKLLLYADTWDAWSEPSLPKCRVL